MGNTKCCGCMTSGEFVADEFIGIDDDNVTEKYQYHKTKIPTYSIKLSKYDKFYREACFPLHLLQLSKFNEILDRMIAEEGKCKVHDIMINIDEDTDYIKATKFLHFFQENAGESPISLFYKQMADENSPFHMMLKMNKIFLCPHEKSGMFTDRAAAEAATADPESPEAGPAVSPIEALLGGDEAAAKKGKKPNPASNMKAIFM